MEKCIYNAYKTHFVLDTNDGPTLPMKGDTDVKFADVVSGGHGIPMTVMLGGCPNCRICVPFTIFQNFASSYPPRGFQTQWRAFTTVLVQRAVWKNECHSNGWANEGLCIRCPM